MSSNQLVHQKSINQPKINKIAANNNQIKLTIDDVSTIFNADTGNPIKIFCAGGLKFEDDMGGT